MQVIAIVKKKNSTYFILFFKVYFMGEKCELTNNQVYNPKLRKILSEL